MANYLGPDLGIDAEGVQEEWIPRGFARQYPPIRKGDAGEL